MPTVRMDLGVMFNHREPWDCSNSQANLGDQAARLTWACALEVARNARGWLLTPLTEALDYITAWARETGAWDAEEIKGWSNEEALALLVQNVAQDMRMIGSDNDPLETCAETYASTDWDSEPEYPTTHVFMDGDKIIGEVFS